MKLNIYLVSLIRIHDFRLILIAERDTVYEKFPTPLINRLEKHFVLTSSILKDWQQEVLIDFNEWIKEFSTIRYFKIDHSVSGAFTEYISNIAEMTVGKETLRKAMLSLDTRKIRLLL